MHIRTTFLHHITYLYHIMGIRSIMGIRGRFLIMEVRAGITGEGLEVDMGSGTKVVLGDIIRVAGGSVMGCMSVKWVFRG